MIRHNSPQCPFGRQFDAIHPVCKSCGIDCALKLASKPLKLAAETSLFIKTDVTIILPFKLPTWNQLLAMQHFQRAKVTKWIKERVLECTVSGKDWPTPMGSARKLLLMDSSLQEYSQMITPNASEKFRSRKKLAKLKKQ